MRIVPTHMVRPGMRLGRSLYDPQGRLVIAAGVTLRPRLLALLERQGYTAVYIADEFGEIELPEIVKTETRQEVTRCVKEFMLLEAVQSERFSPAQGGPRSSGPKVSKVRYEMSQTIKKAADLLVNDILSQKEVVIGLVDIKSLRDYSFGHSVQVAMSALVVARFLGYTEKELKCLGAGALLHDIGKAAIPASIWEKPGDLSTEEFWRVKDHPALGFEILRRTELGLTAAHVALQHHERWDGSGYPRGLSRAEIMKHARITAVCDVFDAMTSDRPYKKAIHPFDSLSFIAENSGILFDPQVVAAFSRLVAPFPVATSVILSTGETAIVKKLNPHNLDRPVVVVTKDRNRRFCSQPRTVDLEIETGVRIVDYAEWYSQPEQDKAPRSGSSGSDPDQSESEQS